MVNSLTTTSTSIKVETNIITSIYLERDVTYDCYLPKDIVNTSDLSLLLINDGQELPKFSFEIMLNNLLVANEISPLFCVGIYCGPNRKQEYGTAYSSDFDNRGNKAGLYSKFILDELLPAIRKKYNTPNFKEKSFAGFSLGALSALDIVWNYASEFSKVGIFSGSLWWRRKAYDDGYNDETDRLMHLQIRYGTLSPWLQFFIQTGLLDEKADRNNNGIIDSIDDALDLIVELKAKGYTNNHIKYLEMPDGKHDVESWGKAFPDFLKWGWGK
jgi:predicted alpha/beta superfamily hydrolase